MLKIIIKRFITTTFNLLQTIVSFFSKSKSVVLFQNQVSDEIVGEIRERLRFYAPTLADQVKINQNVRHGLLFTGPLLVTGVPKGIAKFLIKYRKNTYYVDYSNNPRDGWEWCQLSLDHGLSNPDIRKAHQDIINYINGLQACGYKKAYLFGTGPSLARALDNSWDDGYRVVCNTIVRDKELWHHINPHFVVAGDAIYHFGFTRFAKSFREDLKSRLLESDTKFIYPVIFHEIVSRELREVADKLLPIPYGRHKIIHNDLTKNFALPRQGNVLNLLMLPLACTLAKNVYLWGFDGRAPKDKLFWSNSSKHSYPEYIDELRNAHPAFFSHYVPENNPGKYVNEVHGDTLENNLTNAERFGWCFHMLHDSYTPSLQKRKIT